MSQYEDYRPSGSWPTIIEIVLMIVCVVLVIVGLMWSPHQPVGDVYRDGSARQRNAQVFVGPVEGGRQE